MSHPQLALEIVQRVLSRPEEERVAAVDEACAGDAGLRAEVEALLAEQRPAHLDEVLAAARRVDRGDAPTVAAGVAAVPGVSERPGTRIGRYQLLTHIGEGGFGSVYLAQQTEPVTRQVALKVLKPGMDSRQVVARFEQERQALALMDHPHIAKVLDAGATATGRPYFVMEYVEGQAITAYCDDHRLPVRERVELFVQVCTAVQHAHSKGIIHRDLKPSNVLVVTQDGRPSAKVIDFGIAKAIAGGAIDSPQVTEQLQLIGTREYMSPEQAEGSPDIDTRSDVYSLGVLLYELLTGATPFGAEQLRAAAYAEIQRIIREVDPPTPSTRLGQSGATLVTLATHRRTEPRRLESMVRGELDWVVMKALEKERERRYETANGLAADLRRYLAGEAVTAAPPGVAYRARKFAHRHRAVLAVSALVGLLLIGATAGIAWQAAVARTERDKAQIVAEFMADTLSGVDSAVARGRDTTMLREMMEEAAGRIEKGELRDAPEAELALRGTIGATFRDLARFDDAARMAEPALALARSRYRGDDPVLAQAIEDLAQVQSDRGELDAAEPLYREALAMYQRLYRGDHEQVATALNNLASAREDSGDAKGAEPIARQALEMRRRLFQGDHEDLVESLNNLASILAAPAGLGQLDEGEALFREALAMNRRLNPGDHPRVAAGLNNLSYVLKTKGNVAEAETLARETLDMRRRLFGNDYPHVATGLNNLAQFLVDRGDLAGAEPLIREAVAILRARHPKGHQNLATYLVSLGRTLTAGGNAAGAVPILDEGVEMYVRLMGKDFWLTGNARLTRGRALAALERFPEAETDLLEAQRIFSTAQGVSKDRQKRCFEAVVALYTQWDKAQPGRGHAATAATWQARLAESGL